MFHKNIVKNSHKKIQNILKQINIFKININNIF